MVKIKRAGVCMKAVGVTVSDTTAGPEHRGSVGGLPIWRLHVFLDTSVGTDVRRSFCVTTYTPPLQPKQYVYVMCKTAKLVDPKRENVAGIEFRFL